MRRESRELVDVGLNLNKKERSVLFWRSAASQFREYEVKLKERY